MFSDIIEYYAKLDESKESSPVHTQKGKAIPSYLPHVIEAFTILAGMGVIRKGSAFLDEGLGDGRVMAVAERFGMRPYGIEYEARLCAETQEHFSALGIQGSIIQGDFSDPKTFTALPEITLGYNYENNQRAAAKNLATHSPSAYFLHHNDERRNDGLALRHQKTFPVTKIVNAYSFTGWFHLHSNRQNV